jgi:UrcA family protein
MNSATLRFRLKAGAIVIVGAMIGGLLTPGALAMAQPVSAEASSPAPVAESVTVIAPRVVRRHATGAGQFGGSPIEVLSVSLAVSFADLDLTKQTDVDQFRKRIMHASLDACDRIEAQYPSNIYVPVSANHNCPDNTAREALSVADEIIAATKSRAR